MAGHLNCMHPDDRELVISWLLPRALWFQSPASALENLAGGSRLGLGQCNEKGTLKANFPEEKD